MVRTMSQEPIITCNPRKICRDIKTGTIFNREEKKRFNFSFDKRAIVPGTFNTRPFGYWLLISIGYSMITNSVNGQCFISSLNVSCQHCATHPLTVQTKVWMAVAPHRPSISNILLSIWNLNTKINNCLMTYVLKLQCLWMLFNSTTIVVNIILMMIYQITWNSLHHFRDM